MLNTDDTTPIGTSDESTPRSVLSTEFLLKRVNCAEMSHEKAQVIRAYWEAVSCKDAPCVAGGSSEDDDRKKYEACAEWLLNSLEADRKLLWEYVYGRTERQR